MSGIKMIKIRHMCLVISILMIGLMLCGFDYDWDWDFFGTKKVKMDTQEHRVYQTIEADTIIREKDKRIYDDKNYLIYGVVSGKKEKEFVITAAGGKDGITCKAADDTAIRSIKGIEDGKTVKAYGEVSVNLLTGTASVKLFKVLPADNERFSGNSFCTMDGRLYKKSELKMRELHKGAVKYYILPQWTAVEHNIRDEELGTIEGYQYRLNELKDGGVAESLFISYFDKGYIDINDRDETELIEKRIIKDILCIDMDEEISFPLKKVETPYGVTYKYYRGEHKDNSALGSKNKYWVEFAFQDAGDDGIIVYTYVYQDGHSYYIDDIMLTLRLVQN